MNRSSRISSLSLVPPEAFFQELVSGAARNQGVAVIPEVEMYLVGILKHFMSTENLYVRDAQGVLREEPLALIAKEAMEERSREAQSLMFRYLGDFSLYVAGYFQESIGRKLVPVNYYIDLGGAAYRNVAQLTGERHLRTVYSELSERFGRFVNLLAEVSEKTTPVPRTEQDLLRAYDLWISTKSERSAKILEKAGIRPISSDKKKH